MKAMEHSFYIACNGDLMFSKSAEYPMRALIKSGPVRKWLFKAVPLHFAEQSNTTYFLWLSWMVYPMVRNIPCITICRCASCLFCSTILHDTIYESHIVLLVLWISFHLCFQIFQPCYHKLSIVWKLGTFSERQRHFQMAFFIEVYVFFLFYFCKN